MFHLSAFSLDFYPPLLPCDCRQVFLLGVHLYLRNPVCCFLVLTIHLYLVCLMSKILASGLLAT